MFSDGERAPKALQTGCDSRIEVIDDFGVGVDKFDS